MGKITTRDIIAYYIRQRAIIGRPLLYSHEIETLIPLFGESRFHQTRNASTYQRKFREMKQDGYPELAGTGIKLTPANNKDYAGNIYNIEKTEGLL